MSKEKPLQNRFHDPLPATDAFLSPSPKDQKNKGKKNKDEKEATIKDTFPSSHLPYHLVTDCAWHS